MDRAVPYFSRNSVPLIALILSALVLSACARSAPDLPPDYGSVKPTAKLSADSFDADDLRLNCSDMESQKQALTSEASQLNGIIQGNRQHNPVAGYLGGLFLFPALAARENPEEKNRLDGIQARWDTLIQLGRFRQCP
jgi:hypothetical protein